MEIFNKRKYDDQVSCNVDSFHIPYNSGYPKSDQYNLYIAGSGKRNFKA